MGFNNQWKERVFGLDISREIYNIVGNNEKENIEIVKIIEYLQEKTKDEKINKGLIKHVKDRLVHDRRYAIDPRKIKEELGWEPEKVITVEYLGFYRRN